MLIFQGISSVERSNGKPHFRYFVILVGVIKTDLAQHDHYTRIKLLYWRKLKEIKVKIALN